MKGFMHIVEILLVVILIFFAFMQFTKIPSVGEDWSKIKLSVTGNDMLKALEKKNVNWFDETLITEKFDKVFGENIIYSVTLKNVIKPKIKIGCLCSDEEYAIVESILSEKSFPMNGVNITFEMIKVSNAEELFSLDFDVALIYGQKNINKEALKRFLWYDKGVMEISDLKIADDSHKTIFGVDTKGSLSSSSKIIFSDASKELGNQAEKIYTYFEHIPFFYDTFEDTEKWFDASLGNVGKLSPSLNLSHDCISSPEQTFTRFFNSFTTGDIDFDVYLKDGASVFIKTGRSSSYDYFASISSNESLGYSSFYRKAASLESIGWNDSYITNPNVWHHVKISVRLDELTLYIDGKKVASAQIAGVISSNISFYSLCGEAYIDNLRITFEDDKIFENFLENENTTQVYDDKNKILLEQIGTRTSACIINYNIEGVGKGRTVWLSNSTQYTSDEYKTLVKALLVWVAGDEYRVKMADIKKPVSTFIYKTLNEDMLQNVKIILELGYVY